MKLKHITESVIDKSLRQFRELIRKGYGFVSDVDALVKHIIDGCNSSVMLIENGEWWEELVPILAPITQDDIQKAGQQAESVIMKILQDPEQHQLLYQEMYSEGILGGAWNILKSIVAFLVKAATAGLAVAGKLGAGGHGGHGGRGGAPADQESRKKMFIGNLNVKTIEAFFTALEPAAEAAANGSNQTTPPANTPTTTSPPVPAAPTTPTPKPTTPTPTP